MGDGGFADTCGAGEDEWFAACPGDLTVGVASHGGEVVVGVEDELRARLDALEGQLCRCG